MPGTATFDPPPLPQAMPARPALVFKYDPNGAGLGLTYLPNVECIAIQHREGPDPGQARFRYRTDIVAGAYGYPQHFEQLLGDSQGDEAHPAIVKTGQRIAVAVPADWGFAWLFDGFADLPQLTLSDQGQAVTFTAAGFGIRSFDNVLFGCRWRSSSDYEDPTKDGEVFGEPIRFNPEGEPNCIPLDLPYSKDAFGNEFAAFMDRNWFEPVDVNPFMAEHWTLGEAARYILARGNPRGHEGSFAELLSPNLEQLRDFLSAHVPFEGVPYDPADPTTYRTEPIIIGDVDVTGMTWPEALDKLIRPHGFRFTFRVEPHSGIPLSYLAFYRVDGGGVSGSRVLGLQPYGQPLNPALTNVQGAEFNRDLRRVTNAYFTFTQPTRVEVSCVLAPLFKLDAFDDEIANKKKAIKTNNNQLEGEWVRKYRWFGLDEAGEGHSRFDFAGDPLEILVYQYETTPADLSAIMPQGYAVRRRPIAPYPTDGSVLGRIRRPTLHLVTGLDKSSIGPAGPGIWQGALPAKKRLVAGGWRLLKDRIGIEVTVDDPNSWDTGRVTGSDQPGQKINLIDMYNQGAKLSDMPWFVLTCLIDTDEISGAVAKRRNASPQPFQVTRMIDGRSRYRSDYVIVKKSLVELDSPVAREDDYFLRNDTLAALGYAQSHRSRTEQAPIAGAFTIPYLTLGYEVGSRIRAIEGRNLDLRVNAGVDTGEAPLYPYVVGISWDFDGGQRTTLHLSDRRAERE